MKSSKCLSVLCAVLVLSACSQSFEVYDLRCEGMTEPMGIDTALPHFSWKIRSFAAMEQYAYEIEVGPDLWQSGKVVSAEQVMVPYGGSPLASRQQAWWRVRVWSAEGKESSWSPKQRFGVGIIGDDRLEGDYIGAVPGEGRAPLLRKIFTVNKKGRAMLYVNSLGYHEAFLNGRKVSDAVLQPAVSQLDKRSLIVAYDVTDLLKRGRNELCIAAGSGWYKSATFGAVYDGPLVKAELDLDGEAAVWTDASWEGAWSGYSDPGTWKSYEFAGEVMDARVEPEWGPVDVVALDGIEASMQNCEPCRIQETLKPVSVERVGDSSWRVDFGRIVNALFEIRLPALQEGRRVRATYADEFAERFDPRVCGYDEYIISGNADKNRFVNRFNHHIFRYVQLDGLADAPALEDMEAHRMRTDYPVGGYFHSSDDELNSIYDLVAWSMENLAFDGYMVDCASIERLGYGGDGNASTLSLQILADVAPLYMNWLQAWEDSQRPDGSLPHTAPNPYKAGGGPYWCSFPVQASWRTWMSYADKRPMERFYPVMLHWLDYVDAYTVDGLLKEWPALDYRWWYLGDWAAPDGVDVQDPASIDLVNNCALVQSLADLEQMAILLGRTADADDFHRRLEDLRPLVHNTFYHPEDSTYASGSQIDMVYPMLVGVVPDDFVGAVKQKLFQRTEAVYDGHLATGLVGIPVLSEWATLAGECDWMCGMLKQHGYPGYLHMLDNGATGVWEHWNGRRSHLHNCFNGIGSWFYQALGGIIPDKPGYRHVTISPQIPEGLEEVEVRQETPYGTISVRREGRRLEIVIPVGVTATVGGMEFGNGRHQIYI